MERVFFILLFCVVVYVGFFPIFLSIVLLKPDLVLGPRFVSLGLFLSPWHWQVIEKKLLLPMWRRSAAGSWGTLLSCSLVSGVAVLLSCWSRSPQSRRSLFPWRWDSLCWHSISARPWSHRSALPGACCGLAGSPQVPDPAGQQLCGSADLWKIRKHPHNLEREKMKQRKKGN